MNPKAQISIDFTMAVMVVMILFLVILYAVHSQQKVAEYVIQSMDAKHVSEKLALRINDVYLAGNGAVRNITLPREIRGGKSYTLRVYPKSVLVNYSSKEGEKFYSHRTLTKDINGSESGLELASGKIRIANINGTIYLENA